MVIAGPFEEDMFCLQHKCALNHLALFYLMFGRQAVLPVDLMHRKAPESEEPAKCVAQLAHSFKEAFQHVRRCTGMKQQRQKQNSNKQMHVLSHEVGTQVWLHQFAISWSSSKKLHHPWAVSNLVVKWISDVNSRIQHAQCVSIWGNDW